MIAAVLIYCLAGVIVAALIHWGLQLDKSIDLMAEVGCGERTFIAFTFVCWPYVVIQFIRWAINETQK